jgi:sortase (surface protein transpeptidase)
MNDYVPRLVRGAVIGMFTVLAAMLTIGGLGQLLITPGRFWPAVAVPPTANHASAGQPAPAAPPPPVQTPLTRSTPTRVSIPAIHAASSLVPLGLNPDQTLQVPPLENPMQAGWYSLGPTPGEVGASVIVGHVDGYSDAGIFYRLHDLKPGDQILVGRTDGTTARFTVYETELAPKDDFPTGKVYAATARPELRLITCGGSFDWQSENYLDNVIVFAALTR